MNPGIGKTSKRKNWQEDGVNYGWQSIAIRNSLNRSVPSAAAIWAAFCFL